MKLKVKTRYLDPIELEKYEWVSVTLPDGREVTVFSDAVYVATVEDRQKKKDGKEIWSAKHG